VVKHTFAAPERQHQYPVTTPDTAKQLARNRMINGPASFATVTSSSILVASAIAPSFRSTAGPVLLAQDEAECEHHEDKGGVGAQVAGYLRRKERGLVGRHLTHISGFAETIARRPERDEGEYPVAGLDIYLPADPVAISGGIALLNFAGEMVCDHSGFGGDLLNFVPQFDIAQKREHPGKAKQKHCDAFPCGAHALQSRLIQSAVGRLKIFHQLVMRSGGVEDVVLAHGFLDFAAVHAGIDADAIAGFLTGFAIPDPRHGVAIGGLAVEDDVASIDPSVFDGYAVRAGIGGGALKSRLGAGAAIDASAGALHGHRKRVAVKGIGRRIAVSVHHGHSHVLGVQIVAIERAIDCAIHADAGPLLICFHGAAQHAFRTDFPQAGAAFGQVGRKIGIGKGGCRREQRSQRNQACRAYHALPCHALFRLPFLDGAPFSRRPVQPHTECPLRKIGGGKTAPGGVCGAASRVCGGAKTGLLHQYWIPAGEWLSAGDRTRLLEGN